MKTVCRLSLIVISILCAYDASASTRFSFSCPNEANKTGGTPKSCLIGGTADMNQSKASIWIVCDGTPIYGEPTNNGNTASIGGVVTYPNGAQVRFLTADGDPGITFEIQAAAF